MKSKRAAPGAGFATSCFVPPARFPPVGQPTPPETCLVRLIGLQGKRGEWRAGERANGHGQVLRDEQDLAFLLSMFHNLYLCMKEELFKNIFASLA